MDLTRYWKESTAEENEVYFSPNELEEKVGYIAPFALGNALTVLAQGHFACYLVSCGMPPSVLNMTVDQTVEVTLPDTLSTRSTWLAQEA